MSIASPISLVVCAAQLAALSLAAARQTTREGPADPTAGGAERVSDGDGATVRVGDQLDARVWSNVMSSFGTKRQRSSSVILLSTFYLGRHLGEPIPEPCVCRVGRAPRVPP